MALQWQLLTSSLPSALSLKDGVGGCVLNGKMYAMGGWSVGNTRYKSVSYSTDGITWTASSKTASWTPRHCMPVIAHDGHILVLGGDQNSGAYQPDVHSWTGLETDEWVVETTSAPWGNRAGHIAFSLGGYVWVGFGQTLSTLSGTPTTFFTDLWRSETGRGDTWELFEAKCVSGYRGYLCGHPAVLDDEVYFIGGGTYDTADFGTREYKNDIFAMNADGEFRLVNHGKNSPVTKLMYHNIAALGDDLFVFAGWAGADQNKWFKSSDKGITWTQQSTPPWSARHAAMIIPYNDALYFGTGLAANDMWKLYDLSFGPKVHLGSIPDGNTGLGTNYTVIDKTITLTPGLTVAEMGFWRNTGGSMVPKIAKQIGTSNVFDIVWSGSAVTHPGGGYATFPITNFTVPSDGSTYRVGFNFSSGSDQFCHAGPGRWLKAGNTTGTGQTFSHSTDGSYCMSWTEL